MSAADDDDLLAAELALGLLDEAEAQAARERLRHDAAFAHAHARWQSYAAGLTADLGEAPPPHVWTAIEARLPANDDQRTSERLWRAGAIAAALVVLALGINDWQRAQFAPPSRPIVVAAPATAPLVAVLSGKSGVVSVSYDPANGRLASVVSGVAAGSRAVELWVIPADGRPRSLGLLSQDRPGWRAVPGRATPVLRPGVTLAVSLEPAGGSPTGLPTGPVIATGTLASAG
jgi:anti-sigma-K factor RskA